MSRGFVKEDDALPPPLIPPRAPLPAGVPNYVTPPGLALLRAELTDLEAERARLDATPTSDQAARTQQLLFVNGRISALTSRLSSARVVATPNPPPDEVRFGATVTLQPVNSPGPERRFTIVGVDEADASEGLVAFVAPIARAVIGKKVGQTTTLRSADGEELLRIASITYATPGEAT
ncbi:MAG TPA: GreA/GreB family elongation factor [bacterium]|nr:GreA/GreB family elongation factor [bacterium]